jgi:TM2 domain-containing membrane protein YozV
MNCINHPDIPAVAYCRTCGKALCEACQCTAQGTVYCAEHLPVVAGPVPANAPAPQAQPRPSGYTPQMSVPPLPHLGTAPPWTGPSAPAASPYPVPGAVPYTAPDAGSSPGLAFVLGLIPGVGAIYNGQYVKGLIHVIILGLLISIINSPASGGLEPLFGMLIAVWWFYMAFEAYHTARKRQMGHAVDEFSSIVPLHSSRRGFPAGPVLLIAFGVLFLLNTMNWIRFDQVLRYWPVLLIFLGAYMLYERIAGPGSSIEPEVRHEQR